MILAVDFDHTICDTAHPAPGYKMGPPMEGAVETLAAWKTAGHTVIVHSLQGDKAHVRAWLAYFKVPFDDLTNIKPAADLYLDDKAVRFTTWPEAAQYVEETMRHV